MHYHMSQCNAVKYTTTTHVLQSTRQHNHHVAHSVDENQITNFARTQGKLTMSVIQRLDSCLQEKQKIKTKSAIVYATAETFAVSFCLYKASRSPLETLRWLRRTHTMSSFCNNK